MKTSKICEIFSLFANIPTEEAMKYLPIIEVAKKSIENNLKDKSYLDEFSYELELLCGAKVFYDYLLTKATYLKTTDSSVKVGGITEKHSTKLTDNIQYAKELYTKYSLLFANLFVDNEFMFGSV